MQTTTLTITADLGYAGLWYVTSAEYPGLHVADESLAAVLAAVPRAIEDLEAADRQQPDNPDSTPALPAHEDAA